MGQRGTPAVLVLVIVLVIGFSVERPITSTSTSTSTSTRTAGVSLCPFVPPLRASFLWLRGTPLL